MKSDFPLMSSRKDDQRVVPIIPHHQNAGVRRRRILYKVDFLPHHKNLPVPDTDNGLRDLVVLEHVRMNHIGRSRTSDEVAVLRGRLYPDLVHAGVLPEEGVANLGQVRDGREPLEDAAETHPESGEDRCRLGSLRVRVLEELCWHLAVSLDHGPHGGLLGGVCHRVNVHATVVGLEDTRTVGVARSN